MNNTNALIIIAKHPEKAKVKTRLAGPLSDKKRIMFYMYLVEDTMKRLGGIMGVDTIIAFAPQDESEYFAKFKVRLLPLPAGDLGERMFYAFKEVFQQGYKKAALVGVDIPALSDEIIAKAFHLLSESDVVFGPAKDGGYYLIGMKKVIRELFEGVPWSSKETLRKSIEHAQQAHCSVSLTETLSDIDTIDDVKRAGFKL
jgi:rSAM/selenodomain-associated transferase 1